jgi:hypothetical protein
MRLHLLEVALGEVEVVGGHAGVDHAVVEDLVGFVTQFDFVEEFGDDAELFALFLADHTLDERGVGEVVGLDVFVLHFFLAVPRFPEFLAADLAVDDGVVADGAWGDSGLVH